MEKIFDSFFLSEEIEKPPSGEILSCSNIEKITQEIPSSLENLLKDNSERLNSSQKEIFINFLLKYKEIFSEKIVTGNCDIKHRINVRGSFPIKQVPYIKAQRV